MALRMKDFSPEAPVSLAFTSLQTNEAPDNGYGPAVVFSTTEGSLYLSPAAGQQVLEHLHTLGVQPNEPVRLVRKGQRLTVTRVTQPPAPAPVAPAVAYAPPEPAPTYAAPAQPAPVPLTQMSAPAPVSKLMACFMQSIDAIGEAQAYADRRGLKITFTSEDVRSTAIACWIDACKGGR